MSKKNILSYIVIVACMSADGDFLEKGKVLDLDKDKDEKIISLGLVEEYDEDKHKNQTKTNPELDSLTAENKKLKEKIAIFEGSNIEDLIAENETLKKDKELSDTERKELLQPEIEALNATIEDLKNLVIETSKLPKDKLPEGFAKYQTEV